MKPGLISRPAGTHDWLFMHFYREVEVFHDGAVSRVPADTALLWRPQARHYYGNRDREWEHSWMHCAGTLVERSFRDFPREFDSPFALPHGHLADIHLTRLFDELSGKREPDPYILVRLFEIFVRELRRALEPGSSEGAVPDRLLEVRRYIERHLENPAGLEDLAAMAGSSVSRFSAAFKKCFGRSPINFILALRLQKAARLLENHMMTVGEAAQELGFSDPFYFSRQFKKHFGKSPVEFRKSLGYLADAE
jgi:AraC-like DNA-binding protein